MADIPWYWLINMNPYTLPETNIAHQAPENRPLEKETSTFWGYVSFREGNGFS